MLRCTSETLLRAGKSVFRPIQVSGKMIRRDPDRGFRGRANNFRFCYKKTDSLRERSSGTTAASAKKSGLENDRNGSSCRYCGSAQAATNESRLSSRGLY